MMVLEIVQGGLPLLYVERYRGPVPRVGEYIRHPNGTNFIQVKVVEYEFFVKGTRRLLDYPEVTVSV